MVELELPKNQSIWQKQQISVPFIWEAKPGTTKNDWKVVRPSQTPPPPPPHPSIKLIASVPFEWEEKPGKPLPSFYKQKTGYGNKDEASFSNQHESKNEKETFYESSVPPRHPPIKLIASIPFEWEEKPGKPLACYHLQTKDSQNRTHEESEMIFKSNFDKSSFETKAGRLDPSAPHPPIKLIACIPFDDDENDSDYEKICKNEKQMVSESDSETLSFCTDESFSSSPSMQANCHVPAVTFANSVPVLETVHSPPGYESDSSTTSSGTGTAGLVGAPFLERLFPLLSPKLNFLEKVGCPEEEENSLENNKMKLQSKDFDGESSFSASIRRPTTLGELIMMSRRRSYFSKAVQIRRHNSVGSIKNEVMGCFLFGINNKIEEFQRKIKKQLQLKLI